MISIHALREEGDGRKGGRPRKAKDFYPRPPRGGRQGLIYDMMDTTAFLSMPSARRATDQTVWPLPSRHISIHALREEGDLPGHPTFCWQHRISIHALREEGDEEMQALRCCLFGISIHALREEGDQVQAHSFSREADFYPRPPRGGRRISCTGITILRYFYPRPPRGGRLIAHFCFLISKKISIHALREEGDAESGITDFCAHKFLSTPSARRATAKTEKNISAFVSL